MTETPKSTVPATNTKQDSIQKMRNLLSEDGVKKQFNNALGEASAPFIASVMEIYSSDSTLMNCNPSMVIAEALKAAILKLPIIKSLGFAYIVPFKRGEAYIPTFIPGYKGYIQLAMRTGQYKTINADKVYEGELQVVNKLTGEINFGGTRKNDTIVGYFAYFELLNGFSKTYYVTKTDILAHAKKYSKSYNSQSSPWKTEEDAMSLKTVIRHLLSHYGYLSVEMMHAMADDNEDTPESIRDEAVQNNTGRKPIVATDVAFEDVNKGEVTPEDDKPY